MLTGKVFIFYGIEWTKKRLTRAFRIQQDLTQWEWADFFFFFEWQEWADIMNL